jgi:hypothetical protein
LYDTFHNNGGRDMILMVDEIINASSNSTVVVAGRTFPWHEFNRAIRDGQETSYWEYFVPRFSCLLTPLRPGDPPEAAPSTIAARGFVSNRITHEFPITAPAGEDAFGMGLCCVPGQDEGIFPTSLFVAIVHADGQILANDIRIVGFTSVGPEPSAYQVEEGKYLQSPNQHFPYEAGPPVRYALRMTNWLLPASTPYEDRTLSENPVYDPAQAVPESWGQAKTQTMIFPYASPYRTRAIQKDDGREFWVPSSPMLHLNLIIGDTMFPQLRGWSDFAADEKYFYIRYEAELRRREQEREHALQKFLVTFLNIFAEAGEVPFWIKAPLFHITGLDEWEK